MLKVDLSNVWGDLSLPDLLATEQEVFAAHKTLAEGRGPGNDFLGWLELPTFEETEELQRIRRAAERIRADSDVFVVVGIGGSYLGPRAAIELVKGQNHNLKDSDPQVFFAGNNLSTRAWQELCELLEGKDFSINIISKSGTTTEPAIATRATLEAHRHAFEKQGLNAIWPRIIALVVQPGVEFDHTNVIDYQPAKATALSQMVENYETLIFEAHSTDYQTPQSLRQLVIDHFAILKVGPALTFALREALFSLAAIEEELVPAKACSGLRQVLENVMLDRPEYWQSHYHGDGNARRLARGYSYSDRVRYYWPDSQIDDAFAHLVRNLADSPIPLPLISQYLPLQYVKVRSGELQPTPRELIINHIQDILAQYHTACEGQ